MGLNRDVGAVRVCACGYAWVGGRDEERDGGRGGNEQAYTQQQQYSSKKVAGEHRHLL